MAKLYNHFIDMDITPVMSAKDITKHISSSSKSHQRNIIAMIIHCAKLKSHNIDKTIPYRGKQRGLHLDFRFDQLDDDAKMVVSNYVHVITGNTK